MYIKKEFPGISLAILIVAGMLFAWPAVAQSQKPLTLEGKNSLYQRVIAVPGAALARSIDADDKKMRQVPPFSTYYVYARRTVAGNQWLQVGSDSNGTLEGWLSANQAIDWKQTLTVGFKDPEEQKRVLLFGDRASLNTVVANNDADAYEKLREEAEQGTAIDSPVAAIQPASYIDIRKDFYLIPILSHEDVIVGTEQARMLRVATVPLQESAALADAYRTGIVFVIDTTVSMGPYIDQTRATMRGVYKAIETANLSSKVSYGLVGFRDNIEAAPGLDYTTRIYADLADGTSGDTFLSRITGVRPATVSSEDFNEDPYAGVQQAIKAIDWTGYYARYVILITDAGPRTAEDPLSTTGLDAEALRQLAASNDISIGVMHLRTPAGAEDHDFAEEQFRRLSAVSGVGDLYYPVEAGDVTDFERVLTLMTQQLTAQVRDAASGRPPQAIVADATQTSSADTQLETFGRKVERLGYALRMRYLQESAGQSVPALFNAWMIDRDFSNPGERSVDVRVLLSRDQLSDLHEVLKRVLITAEDGALAPQDFLDDLKSLAATISRDPQATKTSTRAVGGASLADLGYMREYLEGLPYKSEVMNLDLSIWQQWPAQRQFEFINQLDSKVAYYRALHDNVDLWVSLDGGPIDGDSVYPLLLEALP